MILDTSVRLAVPPCFDAALKQLLSYSLALSNPPILRDGGLYGNDDIPWFNGGLFKKINVPTLTVMEMTELRNAARLNWSAIDVPIFGTLFERGLDPAKRSQLGVHQTDPATIGRIIEPVLQALLVKSTRKGDKQRPHR